MRIARDTDGSPDGTKARGGNKLLKLTTAHDIRYWDLSIAFRRPFRGLLDETIQILIARGDRLGSFEVLQGFVVPARTCGEDAEVHVRPRVPRIEVDGDLQFLRCFFAATAVHVEPAERRVIRGDVVEGAETLRPLILRTSERLTARAVEVGDAQRHQRLGCADTDESGVVCEMRRDDDRHARI